MDTFPFRIRVRSAAGGDDQLVTIESEKTTVQAIKAEVYERFSISAEEKSLRLIFSGKLLEPPSALVASQFNLKPEAVVHAVFTAKRPPVAGDVELGPLGAGRANGQYSSLSQQDGGDAGSAAAAAAAAGQGGGGGFSRLVAERGLDAVQVAAIRSYFAPDVAALSSRMARHDGESDAAFEARVEEVWMDSQSPSSEFSMNLPPPIMHGGGGGGQAGALSPQQLSQMEGFLQRQLLFTSFAGGGRNAFGAGGVGGEGGGEHGSFRDLLVGAMMGFLFGGIAILCIWDRNMTHRQKVGILIGVMVSLLVNLFAQERTAPAAKAKS